MKYMIIGGNSVFSKPLTDLLVQDDSTAEIIVTTKDERSQAAGDKAISISLDIQNAKEIDSVLAQYRPDVVFFIEAQDSVGYAWKNPNETVNINIVGTINLLNAVRSLEYKPRIVIGGSGEEYGHLGFDHLPLNEEETPRPVNIFGATKACQTMLARLYHRAYGIDVVVLRTFNETSVLQDDKWAISSFCHQFVKIERGQQKPIIHTGNTNVIRDFTDVRDLVRAYELVAKKGKSGEVYNAARGEGVSIREIIDLLEEITGIRVTIRTDKSKVRPIDAPSIVADVQKINQDTGWSAKISVRDTLSNLVDKWRSMDE